VGYSGISGSYFLCKTEKIIKGGWKANNNQGVVEKKMDGANVSIYQFSK
jgi:hypothetical protein